MNAQELIETYVAAYKEALDPVSPREQLGVLKGLVSFPAVRPARPVPVSSKVKAFFSGNPAAEINAGGDKANANGIPRRQKLGRSRPSVFSNVEGPLFNNTGWNYWGQHSANPVFAPPAVMERRSQPIMDQRRHVQDKVMRNLNEALSAKVRPRVVSGYDGEVYNMSREAMLRRINAIKAQQMRDETPSVVQEQRIAGK